MRELLGAAGIMLPCPADMAIDFDITGGVIVLRVHGVLSREEGAAYLSASEHDPRYRPDMPRLIVIADDTTFPSSAEIIHLAGQMPQRKLGPGVRLACVARTPLAIGIAAMFMGNAGLGDNYQLFDDETTAREWLGKSGT